MQRNAFQRLTDGNIIEILFEGSSQVSIASKNIQYNDIYHHFINRRAFNVKMLDGGLIQMMYKFVDRSLRMHRLAFFPAPHLEGFEEDPSIYLNDEIFGDVVTRNIVPFPLRFDYCSEHCIDHPKSHLTLGQHKNCRIPVTAPVTPFRFIDFILRHFYPTAFSKHKRKLPFFRGGFPQTIRPFEFDTLHITIPADR